MKKQNHFASIGAATGMLILILDSKTAFSGATAGIALCINTLIPSLFPFFSLSILLTTSLSGQAISFLKPIAAACKIPAGADSLLPISLLGGYPVGAQNISLLYQQGQLSRVHAMRMLAFCNNAGPAFIFGVLGSVFSQPAIPCLLLLIHLSSALFVGILLPGNAQEINVQITNHRTRVTDVLSQSVKAMALVCGWVVLMRIVLSFMNAWFLWLFPLPVQVVLSGILELSNGCIRLVELECEGLRFLIASGLLSLGGICVTLQTASVAEGIPLNLYFPGKILQCSISILLACMFQFVFPANLRCRCDWLAFTSVATILLILSIFHYSKNNSGIPAAVDV